MKEDTKALTVVPGERLGPFELGQPINYVLKLLQDREKQFGLVNVLIGEKMSQLDIPDGGFRLYFDAYSQMLVIIEVFDASRLCLLCSHHVKFEGSSKPPTYSRLYEAFGPTVDTPPDAERKRKALVYPGLLAFFEWGDKNGMLDAGEASRLMAQKLFIVPRECDAKTEEDVVGGQWSSIQGMKDAWSVEMRRRGSAGVSSNSWKDIPVPSMVTVSVQEAGDKESVVGVHVMNYARTMDVVGVYMGDSPQDVIHGLGSPEEIHQARGHHGQGLPVDYIFNYYTRGMDIVFDGVQHEVKTIILHCNPVPHAEFGRYYKCFFDIVQYSEPSETESASEHEDMRQQGTPREQGRDEDIDSCASQWVSAGSSPSVAGNFAVLEKKKKKGLRRKSGMRRSSRDDAEFGDLQSSSSTSTLIACDSTLDDVVGKFGECGQPAVIYWNLGDKAPTRLEQTLLYKFSCLSCEYTTCGRLAAVFLHQTK